MTRPILAAIRFDTGDIDGLLADVPDHLLANGLKARGVLQSRGDASGACHCAEMYLHAIGRDRLFTISQPLGNGSRGCRLDPDALARCSGYLEDELDHGADLVILNRFGRGESEGRGFRDLIGKALTRGVPVLTAVRPTYAEAWEAFGGEMACHLPLRRDAVLDWVHSISEVRHAA